MPVIPARKAVAFSVEKGQEIKIINTYGKQVLDFWAFNPNDPNDFLSMVHSRTVLLKISLAKGDKLYSTRRKPILTLTEDTTRGVHDMIWSACDTERYKMQGFEGYHDNCTDNMHKVSELVLKVEPWSLIGAGTRLSRTTSPSSPLPTTGSRTLSTSL